MYLYRGTYYRTLKEVFIMAQLDNALAMYKQIVKQIVEKY